MKCRTPEQYRLRQIKRQNAAMNRKRRQQIKDLDRTLAERLVNAVRGMPLYIGHGVPMDQYPIVCYVQPSKP